MRKKIKKGALAGLTEITQEIMVKQQQDTKVEMMIPIYTVPVVHMTPIQPQNCKGGDIDSCQNYSWCAQCIDPQRAETGPCEKTIIGAQDLLDVPKYLEHQARYN